MFDFDIVYFRNIDLTLAFGQRLAHIFLKPQKKHCYVACSTQGGPIAALVGHQMYYIFYFNYKLHVLRSNVSDFNSKIKTNVHRT